MGKEERVFTVWVKSGASAATPIIVEDVSMMKVSTAGALMFWSKIYGLQRTFAPGHWVEAEAGNWHRRK